MISNYDEIASEYYSPRHITSRNFDEATLYTLKTNPILIPQNGLILEFGAGRGKSNSFLGIDAKRIIQLDWSLKMLALTDREDSLLRIHSRAEKTPFLDYEFATCAAFLCDPFWNKEFLTESFRVLKDGGVFIGTLPSFTWGVNLRSKLNFAPNTTKFLTEGGKELVLTSILSSREEILDLLLTVGYPRKFISISSAALSPNSSKISSHISISARNQKLDEKEIEIIDIIIAKKS